MRNKEDNDLMNIKLVITCCVYFKTGCVQQTLMKTEKTVSSQKEKLEEAHKQIQNVKLQNNTLLHIKVCLRSTLWNLNVYWII